MKPYFSPNPLEEELRKNWRGNKNYSRKASSRKNKKACRAEFKKEARGTEY